MSNEIRVTREGLQKMQEELSYLRDVKRQEVVDAIALAKSYGDLSENSEYDEAKTEQAKVESRIQKLEEDLKNITVIEGVIVKVFNRKLGKEVEYTIVGATEAAPMLGKISDRSPIGQAIIDKQAGDVVEVETPAGVVTLDIISVLR